jgi:uncharacterized DUF497 family protein
VSNLSKMGLNLADIADVLKRQGVISFWDELIKSVQERLENAGAQSCLLTRRGKH